MNTPVLSSFRKYTAACTALFGLLLASPAFAQLYWNPAPTGNGTWDTSTTSNWNPNADGSGTQQAFSAGSSVVFGATSVTATAYTVTVSGTEQTNDWSINSGNVTFSGGTLVLGTGNLTIASGASLTQGNMAVSIAGAQTWTNNSSTPYTANSFGLAVASDIATPSLTFAGGSFSIRGGLTDSSGGGAFSLTVSNGSSVTFNNTAANTYTGGTNIQAGTLRVTQTVSGIGTGTLTLGSASGTASAMFNPVNSGTVANNITVLAGGNSSIGIGGSSSAETYTGNVTLNSTLTLTTTAGSSTPSFTMSGLITGTGGIAMTRNASNSNSLSTTLSNANT